MKAFEKGTMGIIDILADLTKEKGAITIIGGGDSVAATEQSGRAKDMSHSKWHCMFACVCLFVMSLSPGANTPNLIRTHRLSFHRWRSEFGVDGRKSASRSRCSGRD
jgi:hypothetical protein